MKKIRVFVIFGVITILWSVTIDSVYGSVPLGQTEYTSGGIIVNSRSVSAPPPSVTEGVIMLPLRAVAEALGLTVDWNGSERRIDIGGVYSVWIGRPVISRDGGRTTHEFGPAPEIIDGRTFVPISFFNFGISGVNAGIEDGIVVVSRGSIYWNVVELPDMHVNLWAYLLPHDFSSEDGYEYDTIYDVVEHESGGVTVIWTDTTITDFELIDVRLETPEGREGIFYFVRGETLLALHEFTPDRPIAFRTHYGTMPKIAITFVNEYGTRHYFSITRSGMDGSIEILPFPLDEGIYI